MANVQLTLDLINKVTGNANQIAKDLAKVEAAAKRAQAALGMKNLDRKFRNAYFNGVLKDMKGLNKELNKKPEKSWTTGAIAAGELIKDAFESAAKLLYNGIVKAMDYVGQAEQTQIGLKYQAPYMKNYINKDVGAYGNITGTGNEQIKQQMLPILQALHGRADADFIARQIREASSDLSVALGHGTNDTGEFIDVFQRIINREGLQARQLQRLGVNEKDFYELLGKNLGITEDAAKTAAKNPAQADAVRNTLLQYVANMNKAGSGQYKTGMITEEFSKSLTGRIERLKSLPEDLLASLAGTDALKMIETQLGRLYDLIMKNKDLIANTLLKVVTKLGDFFEKAFTSDNIDKFIGYFEKLGSIIGWVFDNANTLYSVFQGIGVAMVGLKAIGWAEGLAKVLPGIGESLGGTVSVLSAGVLPVILSVGAAMASVAFAVYRIGTTIQELGGISKVAQDVTDFIGGQNASGVSTDGINANSPEWKKQGLGGSGDAMAALNQDRGLQHAVPNSSTITLSPTFNMTVDGGTSNEDLNHTLQEHAQQVNDQMSRLVEQAIPEAGGAPASRTKAGFGKGREKITYSD